MGTKETKNALRAELAATHAKVAKLERDLAAANETTAIYERLYRECDEKRHQDAVAGAARNDGRARVQQRLAAVYARAVEARDLLDDAADLAAARLAVARVLAGVRADAEAAFNDELLAKREQVAMPWLSSVTPWLVGGIAIGAMVYLGLMGKKASGTAPDAAAAAPAAAPAAAGATT